MLEQKQHLFQIQIPFSSINTEIEKSLTNKPRLILLHRSDLISKQDQRALLDYYKRTDDHVLLTSTKTKMNMNAIVPTLMSIKQKRFVSVGSYFAVMGIPNVGKSSIIRHIQKSSLDFRKSSCTRQGITGREESARWRRSWHHQTRCFDQSPQRSGCLHDRHAWNLSAERLRPRSGNETGAVWICEGQCCG